MNKAIEIAFAIDSQGLLPLIATATSVLRRLPPGTSANLHVFQLGLQPTTIQDLTEVLKRNGAAEVHMVQVTESHLAMFEQVNHIPPISYSRLLFPELLPNIDRLIYLDNDLLVTIDLSDLWNEDLDGYAVGAVRDASFDRADQADCLEYCRDELINAAVPPFNAGVLLIDLPKWRAADVYQKSVAFALRHRGRMKNADQDILNVLFSGNCKTLDPKWNVPQFLIAGSRTRFVPPPESAHLAGKPLEANRIYHMWGKHKPWNSGPKHIGREQWLAELKRSGWFSLLKWCIFRARDQLRSYSFSARERYHRSHRHSASPHTRKAF